MSRVDLEQGRHNRDASAGDGSVCFSDADDGSCYSRFFSTNGGSYDEDNFAAFVSEAEAGVVSESRRASSVSKSSVQVEIEVGVPEIKVHLDRVERDCRICLLGLESNSHESGPPIELGCSCKNDLAAAHKHCADTWFKIKGNKVCEICQSITRNFVGLNDIEFTEQLNESHGASATTAVSGPGASAETRSFWHGHCFQNFLLACMVFSFLVSWRIHFNLPS